MADLVYQLVYISHASGPLDDAELDRLAVEATRFNADHAITGLLLHDGWRFIQALEGRQSEVEALMARIERDPRHDSIAYIERRQVQARQFGGWAMEVRRVRDTTAAQAFLDDLKQVLAAVDDHRLIAAFLGFAMLGRPELRIRRAAPGAIIT
ncbi:BLUF domain-containing protein [Sphingomonas sp. 8AM]|uniref:BLUF domain-containing protein n=1 Tax=Sphingomonas sp. 8AM TaxID=2653170 RepID=UPI00135B80AB|nr:BLUF domain-containing protein [Sphingomonas sp. 8AM]